MILYRNETLVFGQNCQNRLVGQVAPEYGGTKRRTTIEDAHRVVLLFKNLKASNLLLPILSLRLKQSKFIHLVYCLNNEERLLTHQQVTFAVSCTASCMLFFNLLLFLVFSFPFEEMIDCHQFAGCEITFVKKLCEPLKPGYAYTNYCNHTPRGSIVIFYVEDQEQEGAAHDVDRLVVIGHVGKISHGNEDG
ncbi:hypothetical protein SCA6_002665 [Theobroma cacao]